MYAQATMTKLVAHVTQQGEPIPKAIAWAEQEIEGLCAADPVLSDYPARPESDSQFDE